MSRLSDIQSNEVRESRFNHNKNYSELFTELHESFTSKYAFNEALILLQAATGSGDGVDLTESSLKSQKELKSIKGEYGETAYDDFHYIFPFMKEKELERREMVVRKYKNTAMWEYVKLDLERTDADTASIIRTHVYLYTMNNVFAKLNESLFEQSSAYFPGFFALLWRARFVVPAFDGDKFYRGVSISDRFRYPANKIFKWPYFISCSASEIVAKKFGNTLFEISTTSSDYWVYDISPYSKYPHEKEILILPHSAIRIKSVSHDKICAELYKGA